MKRILQRTGSGYDPGYFSFVMATGIVSISAFLQGRKTTAFTRYALTFEVQIATNVPQDCVGVGGAPGEDVFVKAGATVPEPIAEIQNSTGFAYYRMNIDPGIQAAGGKNAIVIGNVANSRTNCESGPYELKALNNQSTLFAETADGEGKLWILFATDSGFEGTTSIYYTHIKITAEEI